MEDIFTVTLRRQWTSKLQRECLHNALPPGVCVAETGGEVQLQSSEQSDLSKAVNRIKELVIVHLMRSGSRFPTESTRSHEIRKTSHDNVYIEVDKETDEDDKEREASVKGQKTLNLKDEERDDIGPGTAEDDSRRTVNNRKELSEKEKKEKEKGIPEAEQRLVAAGNSTRSHRLKSREDSQPGGDNSHKTASASNQPETAAEFAHMRADDEQGTHGTRTSNIEPYESLHTFGVKEQSKSFQDNACDSIASDDDVSTASNDGKHKKYQTDEYLWAYIRFIDPASKWAEKLSTSPDTKQDDQTVQLTGSSADIDNLKKFCEKNRLQRAVTRTIQRVSDRCTASAFQHKLQMLSQHRVLVRSADDPRYCELVGKKSDIAELQAIIRSQLVETKKIPDSQQPKTSTGPPSLRQATSSTNNSSAEATTLYSRGTTAPLASSAAASAAGNSLSRGLGQVQARMTQHQVPDTELDFQTELAQLTVRIVSGDLVKWRCEVLVDSCDSELGHAGGLARLFAIAAGARMQAECNKYKREHGCLSQCGVMDTTAGNMQPPVRRLIHACGPSSRSYRSQDECASMLEMTFFNCLLYANDMLRASSIALPAISSGTF